MVLQSCMCYVHLSFTYKAVLLDIPYIASELCVVGVCSVISECGNVILLPAAIHSILWVLSHHQTVSSLASGELHSTQIEAIDVL